MLKILSLVLIGILFVGCGTNKKISITQKPFQMVDEKDAVLIQEGKNKRYCSICGMDLIRFYKTSHIAEKHDKKFQYCSIHCLEDHLGHGVTIKNPMVVDVKSLKFIPVSKANYVVGSKKKGTMSSVSKYAFARKTDAEIFIKKYSGKILSYDEVIDVAQKDFK